MEEVWAVIVGTIVALIVYGVVVSKIEARRQRKAREKSLPCVKDNVRAGLRYDIHLITGQKFLNVELIGETDIAHKAMPSLSGENMLVLKRDDGKRIFLCQMSVRWVEEV